MTTIPLNDPAASNDAARPRYACSTSTVFCPYAATAPHGCGLVALQVVRDAAGRELYRQVCTFCAEQAREGRGVIGGE